MASAATRHRDTLEREELCHRKVLRSLEAVPDERRGDEDFRRALDLYAHLLACRTRWLGRIRGETDQEQDWFPQGWTLAELPGRTDEVYAAWRGYLADLTDDGLERWLAYTSWEGDAYENRIEDVVVQLEGHSLYHRGQIATLVRRCGGRPAATDHVLLTRRKRAD